MVSIRKGEMVSMEAKGSRMLCEFIIPSRGIIGLRNQLLTATAGEAIMSHRFLEYQPWKGEIPGRINGSLVSMENGTAILILLINYKNVVSFLLTQEKIFMKVR